MLTGHLSPQSNRAGFEVAFEIVDDDTDEFVDLSEADIVFEIRNQAGPLAESRLIATEADMVVADGTFSVSFTLAQMRGLCPGTYDVGCTISNADSEPQQMIIGTIAILDGVVT